MVLTNVEWCPSGRADTKAGSLTPNLRRLLECIWRHGYGIIRGLHVRVGDPFFDPPPQIIRTVNLSKAGLSRRESSGLDFALKREQIAFQQELVAIGTGVIDVIKFHDGLPLTLEIQEQL